MRFKLQLILIILSATVGSLGTYPYAKEFSNTLFHGDIGSLLIASIFVPAALSANIALGTYSINDSLSQSKQCNLWRTIIVTTICFLAAASTGFMCFVGYSSKLPITVNTLVSAIVVVVNAGIGFSAINNAINDFYKKPRSTQQVSLLQKVRKEPFKLLIIIVTIMLALMVTLTAYLASTNGLTQIFSHYGITGKGAERFINTLAVFIWFPSAVLFANGSRITVAKMYDALKRQRLQLSSTTILIFIIAFASGSAYAQMSLEFFDASKAIPDVFKNVSRHDNLVFYVIMPLAFLISAVVNGYALTNLLKQVKTKSPKAAHSMG